MERRLLFGTLAVVAALLGLFLAPRTYFVAATFVATGVMIVSAYFVKLAPVRTRSLSVTLMVGAVSALALYGIFYAGNSGVNALNVPGLSPSSEGSIYALIASPSNPLAVQVGVLAFDAVGYEAYFRGVLQGRLQGRLGVGSAFVVAMFDAVLHLATMNLLWVGTTFVADTVWGITYYYGGGVRSSVASHFLWDLAIFILRPIT
jgi:membrane protease YdiL (CAAX protease family)